MIFKIIKVIGKKIKDSKLIFDIVDDNDYYDLSKKRKSAQNVIEAAIKEELIGLQITEDNLKHTQTLCFN